MSRRSEWRQLCAIRGPFIIVNLLCDKADAEADRVRDGKRECVVSVMQFGHGRITWQGSDMVVLAGELLKIEVRGKPDLCALVTERHMISCLTGEILPLNKEDVGKPVPEIIDRKE